MENLGILGLISKEVPGEIGESLHNGISGEILVVFSQSIHGEITEKMHGGLFEKKNSSFKFMEESEGGFLKKFLLEKLKKKKNNPEQFF